MVVDEEFVYFNVCGMKFETSRHTLEKYPSTLLGDQERRKRYYVESMNALFFDRHRQCFEAILEYYQTGGSLIRPPHIPLHLFENEITFFDLGDDALLHIREQEGYVSGEEKIPDLPTNYMQRKIWQLIEIPDSSKAARIIQFWSILVISLSVVIFCLETVRIKSDAEDHNITDDGGSHIVAHNTSLFSHHTHSIIQSDSWEIGCVTWFVLEYLIRFISSPNKWKFLNSILNMVDLLAVLPYLILTIFVNEDSTPPVVLRVMRLLRVFRVFKLTRYSSGLRVLGSTLKASFHDLMLLGLFLLLGMIFFSNGLYYVEFEYEVYEHGGLNFPSIPNAFWYCLVTMTSVGYGDRVPKTVLGKLIGGLCVLGGILMVALGIPVVVTNFNYYHKQERANQRNVYLPVSDSKAISSDDGLNGGQNNHYK